MISRSRRTPATRRRRRPRRWRTTSARLAPGVSAVRLGNAKIADQEKQKGGNGGSSTLKAARPAAAAAAAAVATPPAHYVSLSRGAAQRPSNIQSYQRYSKHQKLAMSRRLCRKRRLERASQSRRLVAMAFLRSTILQIPNVTTVENRRDFAHTVAVVCASPSARQTSAAPPPTPSIAPPPPRRIGCT